MHSAQTEQELFKSLPVILLRVTAAITMATRTPSKTTPTIRSRAVGLSSWSIGPAFVVAGGFPMWMNTAAVIPIEE